MAPRISVLGAVLLAAASAAAEPAPPGAIVLGDGTDSEPVSREANRVGGAVWRVEKVAHPQAEPKGAPLAVLEQLYVDADFDRCLAAGLDPELETSRLLIRGAVDAAARASVFVAACAHAAGDAARAEDVVRRAMVMELPIGAALATTRADFQKFADTVRTAVAARTRHRIEIASEPAGAAIQIDGRPTRCGPAGCVTTVIAGEHVVVAERFGRRTRVASIETPRDTRLVLALDPAPAATARGQLAAALAASPDHAPPMAELGALASDAFGVRVVVVVRPRGPGVTASLFDRKSARIVASVEARGTHAAADATGMVIREWRSSLSTTPLVKNWKFWVIVSAAVAATTTGVYLVARREVRDDLVFGGR